MPFLSVSLSSWWLKLITHTDFALARELVLGFKGDLLPEDDRYWSAIGYVPKWTVEAAARQALADEGRPFTLRGVAGRLEESLVHRLSFKRTAPRSLEGRPPRGQESRDPGQRN